MGTPKIKVYKLERGYSESSDTDIQLSLNDELLPIVDKSVLPTDAYVLKGVTYREESLVHSLGAHVVEYLVNPGSKIQRASHTNLFNVGAYHPIVKNDVGNVIPENQYIIDCVAGTVEFNATPYPTSGTIEYYLYGGATGQVWISSYAPIYDGLNLNYMEKVYRGEHLTQFLSSEYSLNKTTGTFTFTSVISAPFVEYYQLTPSATLFVSDHTNWLTGHLRTNPDVFMGTEDYPSDGYTDGLGNHVDQGAIPKYVDSGFSVNYRNGTVTFSQVVDSVANPVRANYAYHKQIANVTNQMFELVESLNGYTFKAVHDREFPDSIDRRWISRETDLMPINFYINGQVVPQKKTIRPYAEIVAKEYEATLQNGNTLIRDQNYLSEYVIKYIYNTGTGTSAILRLTDIGNVFLSYVTESNDNYLKFDAGRTNLVLRTSQESSMITLSGWTFEIFYNGTDSTVINSVVVDNGFVFTLRKFRKI